MADLVLDKDVRNWVLLPLTLAILLLMLIRQYATTVFFSGATPSKASLGEIREKQAVTRAQLVRGNCSYIPEASYRQRRAFFIAKDTGVFTKKTEAKSAQEQMMSNPDMMTDMMKKNFSGIVPQIAMGAFVSFFFSGFILGKVPFPLSPSFRIMLQRGVDLPSLDVTYFTSLSYYILLLFGLRGVFMLFFRDEVVDETQMMRQQMAGGGNPMGGPDPQKALEAEKAAFDMVEYKSKLEGIEVLATKVLKQRLADLPRRFR
jgi:hypothetical protein